MSFDIVVAVTGVAASAVGALVAALSKKHLEKVHEADRNKIESEARTRLTEIGINLAGMGFTFKIPEKGQRDIAVSEKLLKDVEQGIVEVVATKMNLSGAEISREVESRMQDVRHRIEAIEERFPSNATIDKISSINDALFAQRIEQLTERIAKLEEKALNKWDVALTVSLVVGGIFAVVGATYGVLKALGHVP
jgi:Zn-dependent oligopeptidase